MTYHFVAEETELYNTLARLQFTIDAHKELLGFLISTNSNASEAFKSYEAEYIKLFEEYQRTKGRFETEVVRPYCNDHNLSIFSWNLDFSDRKVTIEGLEK